MSMTPVVADLTLLFIYRCWQCAGRMGSIMRGRGWSALVRACHHNTTCTYHGKSVPQSTSPPLPHGSTYLMTGVDKRFKSSAAFLRSAGRLDGALEGDGSEGNEARTLPQGDTAAHKRPVRVCFGAVMMLAFNMLIDRMLTDTYPLNLAKKYICLSHISLVCSSYIVAVFLFL